MKVLIFAPNAGASMSLGGGVNFAVKQASVLSRDLGAEVVLAGFHSFDVPTLAGVHDVPLPVDRVRVVSAGGSKEFSALRRFPVKLLAYDVLLHPSFGPWIQRTIERTNPDHIWFHDDIPTAALPALKSRRVSVYVHYPLLARTPLICPPILRSRSRTEAVNDRLLQLGADRLVIGSPQDFCDLIWTNSTVTKKAVSLAWGASNAVCVPTYVQDGAAVSELKEKLVLAVGAVSKGKNYHALIEGFGIARPQGWRLKIIGQSRDSGYLGYLRKLVENMGLGESVSIQVDAPRSDLKMAFHRASVICQPAEFEPFGLSFLEGMAAGAIGHSMATEYSGAWVDVLDHGRFGVGYGSAGEFSKALNTIADQDLSDNYEAATHRAREYSRDRLCSRLQESLR